MIIEVSLPSGSSVSTEDLERASIPLALTDCRTCPDPCDEGHSEYPKRFDVDMTSVMLGEVKPYRRQLVVSTGKTDWTHDIMDAHLSLAAIISRVPTQIPLPASPPKVAHTFTRRRRGSRSINAPPKIPGIFTGADSARTAILNGSHKSLAEDPAQDTVLVFPDYRVISDVSRNLDDAYDLMEDIQTPVPAASVFGMQHRNGFRSWILPYSAVIMLCSHKRRDKRCAISAPILQAEFIRQLSRHGWDVHTQLEDPHESDLLFNMDRNICNMTPNPQELHDLQRVLILYNSHIGGHRFAGNVIIQTPSGSSIWYGRVTSHEVGAIVEKTIICGTILPQLLRGGLNLSKPGCGSLNNW